jgi:hypothetical protein
MRFLMILLLALTAGCASDRVNQRRCQVLTYAGAKGAPDGLVQLDESLDASLRAQLPAAVREGAICWYATGESIIAANRGPGVSGYEFVRSPSGWSLVSDVQIILQLPPP